MHLPVSLLNLSMNEGDEYSNPLALLLCGVGDPRNVLLTIASFPDVYTQQVNFVLNDNCPCTLARKILLLYMLYKGIFLLLVKGIFAANRIFMLAPKVLPCDFGY